VPGDLSFRWSNFFEIRDAVHRYLSEGGGSASSFLTTSSSSAKSVTSSSTVRRWKTHLMAPGGIAACLLLPLYRCMPLLLPAVDAHLGGGLLFSVCLGYRSKTGVFSGNKRDSRFTEEPSLLYVRGESSL
jgi:hypothetical protein